MADASRSGHLDEAIVARLREDPDRRLLACGQWEPDLAYDLALA